MARAHGRRIESAWRERRLACRAAEASATATTTTAAAVDTAISATVRTRPLQRDRIQQLSDVRAFATEAERYQSLPTDTSYCKGCRCKRMAPSTNPSRSLQRSRFSPLRLCSAPQCPDRSEPSLFHYLSWIRWRCRPAESRRLALSNGFLAISFIRHRTQEPALPLDVSNDSNAVQQSFSVVILCIADPAASHRRIHSFSDQRLGAPPCIFASCSSLWIYRCVQRTPFTRTAPSRRHGTRTRSKPSFLHPARCPATAQHWRRRKETTTKGSDNHFKLAICDTFPLHRAQRSTAHGDFDGTRLDGSSASPLQVLCSLFAATLLRVSFLSCKRAHDATDHCLHFAGLFHARAQHAAIL